jgi:hypothetical protein
LIESIISNFPAGSLLRIKNGHHPRIRYDGAVSFERAGAPSMARGWNSALLDCRPDDSLGKSTPRVVVSPLLHACLCPPLARNGSQHSLKHERDGASV